MLVIAQVLTELGLERGLQHVLGQPAEQAARADEVDSVGAGFLDEFLSELLLINLSRHGLDRLGSLLVLPANLSWRVETSYTVVRTDP